MTQKNKNADARQSIRRGEHQRRSKRFHDTYLPYLPMTLILFLSVFLSGYTPSRSGTLAYATNVSHSGLLSSTNSQRSQQGRSALSINSALNSAAQAKANDMTARNYWSHNTPDGQEPWVFVQAAGYSYLKAGENLAYGFSTSTDTVQGWMNSASHRANMLDADYTDVGFGFSNSSNYNSSGEETVVVAMYGKPQVASAVQSAPAPAAAPTSTPPPSSPAPAPQTEQAAPAPASAPPAETKKPETITTTEPTTEGEAPSVVVAQAKPISRIESLTKGKAPWAILAVTFLTGIGVAIMLTRHGIALKRLLRDSENFVLHHPLIDSTLFALIILGITLSRTVGFIR